ncbi:MAG: alpha amylase C-terminal domain-containing protein [Verrucomicrobia bacterium]|nr:alpha amylase C-terminal domain-containing protein [Verrucomicrobiota bacterium]
MDLRPWSAKRVSVCVVAILLGSLVPCSSAEDQPALGTTLTETGTIFRVWAPHAENVSVIGDFNSWNPRKSDVMQKDPASGIWSVSMRTAKAGKAYKYLINGNLTKRDPYARAVSSDGKNSVIYDPDAYNWAGDKTVRIPLEDLVIYEIHIGTFYDPAPNDGVPATFYDAIKKLDLLVDMGINCLCVMPVHEFDGKHSWGYNPCDIFAVEQTYGGPDGLKTFVKECHRRGLQVHLDIVHNHYGRENLDMLDFDGSASKGGGDIYFYEETDHGLSMTPWGPRPDFSVPSVRRFVKDNATMWLKEYHVDGFRWDSTVNIRAYDEGQKPIPEGSSLLEELNSFIRKDFSGRWSIAEDSVDIGSFHASWQYSFHHRMMPLLAAKSDAERSVGVLSEIIAHQPQMDRVIYTDNHDEAGRINSQFRIATDIDPENPSSDKARRLSGLGSLITLTSPGIPLLFMGNEMQEDGDFHDDKPLTWGNWRKHSGFVKLHHDLIHLRRNLEKAGPGFQGKECRIAHMNEGLGLLVYWRWHKKSPGDKMVVAVNMSGKHQADESIIFPSPGTWVQRLYSDWSIYDGENRGAQGRPFKVEEGDLSLKLDLAPYSAMIFSLSERPAGDVTVQESAPQKTTEKRREPRRHKLKRLAVSGSFNKWSKDWWMMRPASGSVWEYKAEFTHATNVEFQIVSPGTKWGVLYSKPIDPPISQFLGIGGPPVKVKSPLTGWYLFSFDEESRRFTLEETTPAKTKPPAIYRAWTDAKGRVLTARLVAVRGDRILLEKKDGKRITVTAGNLSDVDRMYVSTVSEE